MKNHLYSLFRPGGNDTALVMGIERDPVVRQQINDAIMARHPQVEQVGFLDPGQPELLMAGGEFCGNATRSAAWQFLQGHPGEIKITVSGVNNPLLAGVGQAGNAWSHMPIQAEPSGISISEDFAVVAMDGITHVLVEDTFKDEGPAALKDWAMILLKSLGLETSSPAAGVMFVSRTPTAIQIRPVVWVRDVKTLFFETACGSGTTAVGLLEALKTQTSIDVPVTQPSGMTIQIQVEFDGTQFQQAVISGPIEVIAQQLSL